jgi:hypothetical protein
MHITALEAISMAYFINPSNASVSLYVYPPTVAKQRLGRNVPVTTNTHAKKGKIVGLIFFYAVRVARVS